MITQNPWAKELQKTSKRGLTFEPGLNWFNTIARVVVTEDVVVRQSPANIFVGRNYTESSCCVTEVSLQRILPPVPQALREVASSAILAGGVATKSASCATLTMLRLKNAFFVSVGVVFLRTFQKKRTRSCEKRATRTWLFFFCFVRVIANVYTATAMERKRG